VRIAIVSTPFIRVPPAGYGGTELFCYELAEELHARGHEVTLFTTGDSVTTCDKRWLYARAEWPPSAYDDASHAGWAFAEIARGGFDVVHTNAALQVPFTRLLDVPVVHTLHHQREAAMSRVYAAHPGVCYVAISRRQLELETPLPRATVIHHGLSPERYPESDRDDGYVLHLGRYAPEKGTHLAIEVAGMAGVPIKLAGRTHPQDRGYVAEHVAPRLGRPGVTEVGEADHPKKLALLRGARALVCPLMWEEPFGLVAIEAMLCGTPVVGFARGAYPEIVEEGRTGFLAPPGDVNALARLLARAAGFDRRACARRARERFSTAVMTDAYEALYTRLASREHARRAAATGPVPSARSSSGR
jgi:glycosyltransferase involved in cell wall biosynthesis